MIRSNDNAYSLVMMLTYFDYAKGCIENINLDAAEAEYFQYTNAMNNLYLDGKLRYTDYHAKIPNIIDKQTSYLTVNFSRVIDGSKAGEGAAKIANVDEDENFSHVFFVKSVSILSRNKTALTYELDLVSKIWMNLSQTAKYNNNASQKETVFKIIQNLLKGEAKLDLADDFNDIQTDVRLDYITTGDQTIEQAVMYLLSKQYYYEQKEQSLKFISYDCNQNKYITRDLQSFINPNSRIWNHAVSLVKDGKLEEQSINGQLINIGTVTKWPKTKEFLSKFNTVMWKYSYNENKFIKTGSSNQQTVNYMNSSTGEDADDQLNNAFGPIDSRYMKASTYWNNDVDLYNAAVSKCLEDNTLVLNVPGVINRIAGDAENVIVENTCNYMEAEDQEKFKEIQHRFDSFKGRWCIGKVVNCIDIKNQLYRQNLHLFRSAR